MLAGQSRGGKGWQGVRAAVTKLHLHSRRGLSHQPAAFGELPWLHHPSGTLCDMEEANSTQTREIRQSQLLWAVSHRQALCEQAAGIIAARMVCYDGHFVRLVMKRSFSSYSFDSLLQELPRTAVLLADSNC